MTSKIDTMTSTPRLVEEGWTMTAFPDRAKADEERVQATSRVTVLGAVVNVGLTAIKGFAHDTGRK